MAEFREWAIIEYDYDSPTRAVLVDAVSEAEAKEQFNLFLKEQPGARNHLPPFFELLELEEHKEKQGGEDADTPAGNPA